MSRRARSIRLTLRIPAKAAARLNRLAAQRGLPSADLARACLLAGLQQLAETPAAPADSSLRWEDLARHVSALLRARGQTYYRTALLRRLAGLSVDRWTAVDQWLEERATGEPARSARLLAKEALVRFGLPARILPALVALAQRVRHRLYMRALRRPAADALAGSAAPSP